MRDKIVEDALKEVGYIEKNSNKDLDSKTLNPGTKDYTKYGKWFGSNPGPWCCKFICYIFNEAGCLNLIKKTAGCGTMLDFFKKKNEFKNRDYTPNKGDIVFINWDKKTNPQHVGIVIKVDNSKIYTVEGNRNNKVEKASYLKSDKRIIGYGCPAFTDSFKYTVIAKYYLRVRKGPGTNYAALSYNDLPCNYKLKNMEVAKKKYNGLVKGTVIEVTETKGTWGKIDIGWVSLDYCKKN